MPTLHVLPNFATPTGLEHRTDPFSQGVYRFIEHMSRRGWPVIHYGRPESTVTCEHVDIPFENYDQANALAGEEIAKRKQQDDIIVAYYGTGNFGAAQANPDLKVIEPAIGYDTASVFAPYRVFTSYAQQHMYYGRNNMLMTPSWFDAVIPNGFEPSEFEYSEEKEDYLLIFGRVISTKGIALAAQLAVETGRQLIVAGAGSLESADVINPPDNIVHVGVCDAEQRRVLMSRAAALIAPTTYVEPFGNMVAEALFSGTPVITSDWGGFVDTNIHGITGYRCRDWQDFINAIDNIDKIQHKNCRQWAESNYTNDVVYNQMDRYFKKVTIGHFYARY